jgi:hypothetical protein
MMLSPKKFRLFLGALGLFLLSLTSSFGQVLVFSATLPTQAPGFTSGFSLPAFDSNLGTLDTIAFSYSIPATGSVSGFYDGSDEFPGGGGSIMSTNILYTPSNVGPGLSPEVIQVSVSVGGVPTESGPFTFDGDGGAGGGVAIPPSAYGLWSAAGGGNLGFTLQTSGAQFFGGGSPGMSFGGYSMNESPVFTVTYTYTPIPEPSTAGLFAAIAVLAPFGRRRRSQKGAR